MLAFMGKSREEDTHFSEKSEDTTSVCQEA
jgi:hypothetical protein